MNARFQATVYGTFFALAIGWVLFIGKGVFVPIVFSVLVVYVIIGLARMLVRLPLVGRFLPATSEAIPASDRAITRADTG